MRCLTFTIAQVAFSSIKSPGSRRLYNDACASEQCGLRSQQQRLNWLVNEGYYDESVLIATLAILSLRCLPTRTPAVSFPDIPRSMEVLHQLYVEDIDGKRYLEDFADRVTMVALTWHKAMKHWRRN